MVVGIGVSSISSIEGANIWGSQGGSSQDFGGSGGNFGGCYLHGGRRISVGVATVSIAGVSQSGQEGRLSSIFLCQSNGDDGKTHQQGIHFDSNSSSVWTKVPPC